MWDSRREYEEMSGRKVVLSFFRLDQKPPLQDLDRHFPSRGVPVQSPTGLEGKEDVRDGRAVKDRDLTVAVF